MHRKLFGHVVKHENYFETGESLRSCWLIQQNASKVSITVMLVAAAKFSITASWNKVSASDCNSGSGRQPEIVIWPPKPEIYLWNCHSYDQNSNGTSGVFDYGRHEERVPMWLRKLEYRRFGANLAISGCLSLSQSLGDTFMELFVVDNSEFAVRISTSCVIFPEISPFPVLAIIMRIPVVGRCCDHLPTLSAVQFSSVQSLQ